MLTPLPTGFQMTDESGVLTITRRWFNLSHPIMLFFSLFWNGFLVFWYSLLPQLTDSEGQFDPFLLIFYLFPLLHVAVGVGLLYSGLAGLFNTTRVIVGGGRVQVQHGPLPWWGARDLEAGQIKQFYTKESVSVSKGGNRSVTYNVLAILRDNRQISFVTGLTDKQQGLFLEKTLEDRLYLRDEPVLGEVDKTQS